MMLSGGLTFTKQPENQTPKAWPNERFPCRLSSLVFRAVDGAEEMLYGKDSQMAFILSALNSFVCSGPASDVNAR